MNDGLLTGTTDIRLQILDERVLVFYMQLMAETDFNHQEIIDAFVRRIHVIRSY